MEGFGVPVGALRDAGASASAVASGAELAGPARALSAALPGGAAAQAGTDAAGMWAATVAALADGMTRHAGALSASARAYAQAETGVATGLRGVR